MQNDSRQGSLWNIPLRLDDVPETGRRIVLTADENIRAAIAAHAGLRSLDRLEATFDATRRGRDGLHVTGEVLARVGQVCVVTLEPVENTVSERIDLDFLPATAARHARTLSDTVNDDGADLPELLENGTVDLGMLAVEYLILGIDPYPRKPGAEFAAADPEGPASGPFAALAALKSGDRGRN